ncbi:hypothetical protein BSL78_19261 [Apostichopus japonicus]|uniref:Uncharacterized protein n=1 Tax=Stichopus japonicus TaxID=307972 RepID=A0A2G8K7E6_STIJA|nr:hypothetical protein BSL78_19261 [Apostichopus japonicus]
MAEGGKEPEESDFYTFIWDDDEPLECGEGDTGKAPMQRCFSFEDGAALQKRVQQLEKELANMSTKMSSMHLKNKDETNEETRWRQRESGRVGELVAKIDAMKKELTLKDEYQQSLRDQLYRANQRAQEERANLESHYKEQIALLKSKFEGTDNVSQLRLLTELDSWSTESRLRSRRTREVHFTVKNVPNEDNSYKHLQYLICYSCKESYDPEDLRRNCSFHPLPPMKRPIWEKDWGLKLDLKKYQSYCYWACCNTLAKKRPEGCCKGRHHQMWEGDILLRQVMLADEENTTNMLKRASSEVHIVTD